MSDDTPQNPLDFLKDLSFAPGWAKEPPKEQTLAQFSGDDERLPERRDRDGRGPRRPFGDRDRGPRRDGGGDGRGDRPPFRDRPFRGDRGEGRGPRREGGEGRAERPFRGREDDRGPRREGGERPPRAEGERPERPAFHGRGPRGEGPRGGFREPRVDVATLPVEVKFLPEQKEMGVVIRKVQSGHRAYPVRELARLFLSHPESCVVRIEIKPDQPELFLHQCNRCGFVTTDPAALRAHMLEKHFDEDFEKTTVESEAPGGAFTCVAKCGISGRLIGPPNHHSFAQRLRDTLHEVAPGMDEDEYRRRLEMVHDEAAIQQWKEEARKRTAYRRKTPPAEAVAPKDAAKELPAAEAPSPLESPVEAAPVEPEAATAPETPAEEPLLDRAMAEAVFEHDIVPKCTTGRKRVSCPFDKAKEIRDPNIAPVFREMWFQEQKSPYSLFIALRGAFRAKRFHLFRVIDGRGMEFVIPKEPVALDTSHAVPELVAILDYVRDHQGCTRGELFAALGVPVEGERTAEQDRILQQFSWIVGSAHLIEYHNGVLALPAEHPYFRQLPRPKAKPEAAAAETVEPEVTAASEVPDAPVVPEVLEAPEAPVKAPSQEEAAEAPVEAPSQEEATETPVAESAEETAETPPPAEGE